MTASDPDFSPADGLRLVRLHEASLHLCNALQAAATAGLVPLPMPRYEQPTHEDIVRLAAELERTWLALEQVLGLAGSDRFTGPRHARITSTDPPTSPGSSPASSALSSPPGERWPPA